MSVQYLNRKQGSSVGSDDSGSQNAGLRSLMDVESGYGPSEKEDECSTSTSLVSVEPERRVTFKKRASQIILQVPVAHLKKIREAESVGSFNREAKHFSDITTLHGPKRIYYGKALSTWFWIVITLCAVVFLTWQITSLVKIYAARPIVSQVSFLINEDGLEFPLVTVCNFNPVRKSYIREINQTGDFSDLLFNYLLQSNADTATLFNAADRADLHIGEAELTFYKKQHPNFTITDFFKEAGFSCHELFMICSFGSRRFDCCKYAKPVLTNLGKCYTLNVKDNDKEWMHRQTSSGVNAGLQIVLDTHLEEQFDDEESSSYYAAAFENGVRYYVHSEGTVPYLSSEGISVSPSYRVYSAIASNKYILLPHEEWGNCSEEWPSTYTTSLPYSTANCAHLCKARYFYEHCGCSPADFNLDEAFPVCTPYQTYQCIDKHVRVQINGSDSFSMPTCTECKVECSSLVYHAYNSYGHGFNEAALRYLRNKEDNWTKTHIRNNFLTINVFFRDMSHTEYRQVQATSLTQILSDIGGNMGLFLGMSVFSFTELLIFLSKISWIAVSKRRRDYMLRKKIFEEAKEKELEEAVSNYKQLQSQKAGGSFRALRDKVKALAAIKVDDETKCKTFSHYYAVGPMKRERERERERERDFSQK